MQFRPKRGGSLRQLARPRALALFLLSTAAQEHAISITALSELLSFVCDHHLCGAASTRKQQWLHGM